MDALINFYDRYQALGFSAAVTGTPNLKGTPCYEVTFTKNGSAVYRHYFDAQTFLRIRSVEFLESPSGTKEQVVEAADFKPFDGILLPTSIQQSIMGQTLSLHLDSVRTNTGVPDSFFEKPMPKTK